MSKQRVIVEAVLAGKSQREVARLYGVSQPRVSQLIRAWRTGGWQALEPQSRRPTSNPNRTPPQVVERVLGLRAQLIADGCDAGPHSIAAILDDLVDRPPGVTTIWRILTRAGLITPEPRKRPKRSCIRFEADLPNECWQADFTHITLANGTNTVPNRWADGDNASGVSGPPNQESVVPRTQPIINNNKLPLGGGQACPWMQNNCGSNDEPFSLHSGGGCFAGFADGSVHWLSEKLDVHVVRQLSDPTDGEKMLRYE